jgi:hypothetical protein
MVAIIAVAIDAHRAGVGIFIVSIIHSTSPIDITPNGADALLLAFLSEPNSCPTSLHLLHSRNGHEPNFCR